MPFVYISNIKKLPKGLLLLIIVILLILIPVIISLAVITVAGALLYFAVRILLPFRKKEKYIRHEGPVISIDENGNVIRK
jgi:hypothetical protein